MDRRPVRPDTRLRPEARLRLLGGVLLALGAAGIAAAWVSAPGIAAEERRVEIPIEYSEFTRNEVIVTAGQPVTFVLRNDDPIDHEWLVGDAAFHERHRAGTEPHHGSRPTEVSLPPGATVSTTVTFRSPGEYRFICHLPGHEAYGMVGVVRVVAGS